MSHRQKLAMIFTMLLGGFFGLLNETLLTTALPRIMKDFNIEYSQVQWLTTAFLLTNGVVIPLSAFIIQTIFNKTSVLNWDSDILYWDDVRRF